MLSTPKEAHKTAKYLLKIRLSRAISEESSDELHHGTVEEDG